MAGRFMAIKPELRRYFLYFLMYSVIGWLYEVFLEVVIYRWGFSNRGVLFGPYCPVYGFGALLFIILLGRLKNKKLRVWRINITPLLVFVGIVLISTAVELLASYLVEAVTGGWPWDYNRFAFNFQGRIALNPSLRFGIGGMVFMYVLQPLFVRLTARMSDKILNIVSTAAFVLFAADVLISVIA